MTGKILKKVLALVLLPIALILLLLFTAGNFMLMIIASICGIGASVAVLAMIVLLVTSAGVTVKIVLMGFGLAAFLTLLSIIIVLGREIIEISLKKAVKILVNILADPLHDENIKEIKLL